MDDHRNLPSSCGDDGPGLDACSVQSHALCDDEGCEIHRLVGRLSDAQITLTVVWAVLAFLVSGIFALGAFALHCWQIFHGKPAPDFPLWMLTIIGAPYAGKFLISVIPKLPLRIEATKE